MDFNTLPFIAFFAAVTFVYYLLPKIIRPYLLLVASYAFYCYQPENVALLPLLMGATLITWACGLTMERVTQLWRKRVLLALSILSCIGILFYFKYSAFFGDLIGLSAAQNNAFSAKNILAPLGLSYFTFQALGYAIDCYRGKYKAETNLLHYALFVSFYPCIFTGPIERGDHLLPQLQHPANFRYDTVSGGAFRMLWGYVKKMVLADTLALYVSSFYAGTIAQNGVTMAAAAVLFSLQLYFDFSGCCDIAIGGARMLGIDLLENFDSPFLSPSYSQLWRRWHKSLTSWFRDYVYIPLGGNRCALWRWCINFLLVFLLSGLWHGADIGYFYWGLLCGVLVLLEQLPVKLLLHFAPQCALAQYLTAQKAKAKETATATNTATNAKTPKAQSAQPHSATTEPAQNAQNTTTRKIVRKMASAPPTPTAQTTTQTPEVQPTRYPLFTALHYLLYPVRVLVVFAEFSFCFVLFASALYQTKIEAPLSLLFTQWNATSVALLHTAFETVGYASAHRGQFLLCAVFFALFFEAFGDVAKTIRKLWFPLRWVLYYTLCFALLIFGNFGQSAFIYQLY